MGKSITYFLVLLKDQHRILSKMVAITKREMHPPLTDGWDERPSLARQAANLQLERNQIWPDLRHFFMNPPSAFDKIHVAECLTLMAKVRKLSTDVNKLTTNRC